MEEVANLLLSQQPPRWMVMEDLQHLKERVFARNAALKWEPTEGSGVWLVTVMNMTATMTKGLSQMKRRSKAKSRI